MELWHGGTGRQNSGLNMAPSVYFTMADGSRAFQAISKLAAGPSLMVASFDRLESSVGSVCSRIIPMPR